MTKLIDCVHNFVNAPNTVRIRRQQLQNAKIYNAQSPLFFKYTKLCLKDDSKR